MTTMDEATRTRLFEEYDQLADRRSKLAKFILGEPAFGHLPEIDQEDLREQLRHMRAYERILERRSAREGRTR